MILHRGHLLLALVLAALAGGAGFLAARHAAGPDAASVAGLLWPNPRTLADFAALDQDGKPFTTAALRDRWSLLFFGFTHCPDICPTTMTVLGQAKSALATAAGKTPLQVVFVSVDPGRDTPDVLGPYVRYFDPAFIGVGGNAEQVQGLTGQLGIPFTINPVQADGSYSVDHSASLFVLDPRGRFVGVISAPHTVDNVVTRFAAIASFIRARDR